MTETKGHTIVIVNLLSIKNEIKSLVLAYMIFITNQIVSKVVSNLYENEYAMQENNDEKKLEDFLRSYSL